MKYLWMASFLTLVLSGSGLWAQTTPEAETKKTCCTESKDNTCKCDCCKECEKCCSDKQCPHMNHEMPKDSKKQ